MCQPYQQRHHALTGLTISDNLGGYTFGGATLYPLAYLPGSVRYYVNGALQAAPVVNAGPPMTVTGITVPAGGSALVIYETEVTRYAPLAAESSIVNTVTVTGGGLAAPVTAEETVGVVSSPRLSITKGLSPRWWRRTAGSPTPLPSRTPAIPRHRDGRCDPPGYLRSGSQRSHGDLQRRTLDCRYAVHL